MLVPKDSEGSFLHPKTLNILGKRSLNFAISYSSLLQVSCSGGVGGNSYAYID